MDETSHGHRTPANAESRLIQDAVGWMVDMIYEHSSGFEPAFETGIVLYDSMPWQHQLNALDQVTTALMDRAAVVARRTAVHDATIAAIFETAKIMVDTEIFDNESTDWRKLSRDAYRQCFRPEDDDTQGLPTTLGDRRMDRWSFVLDLMADRHLPDRDYEMAPRFLDADPENAAPVRAVMGIDDSYFSAVVDDVSPQEATAMIDRIRQLISN